MKNKRSARKNLVSYIGLFSWILALALICFIVLTVIPQGSQKKPEVNASKPKETVSQFKETTATVVNIGDIMVHSPQLNGAYVASKDEYDFSPFFKEVSPYFKNSDLAVGNLEVTFGGSEWGKYTGYPAFNCPDSLADAIKNSGLNLLLTANNHSYDTGFHGLKRTVNVLKSRQLDFVGTKETLQDPSYLVKNVNNINIGIADYTYETSGELADRKYLNGAIINKEANDYINSFSYDRIEDFFVDAKNTVDSMKKDGAEYIVFYLHWGNEYKTKESIHQQRIAQRLCDIGVDMIIGGHPHVIEPIDLLTSSDGKHNTVCLYSLGNAVSNQRQEIMDSCPTGHTEDGMIFEFTLKKTQKGVSLHSMDLTPTWVNKYVGGGGWQYTIYPLDSEIDSKLSAQALEKAKKSYERTKAIVAQGLTKCQEAIGCEITFK